MSARGVDIFLPSLAGGGAERSMLAVANGLAERGFVVTLVLGRNEGAYLAEVHGAVRIVDLRAGNLLLAVPGLAAHLRRSHPDALLSAMSHANVVAVAAHGLARSQARLVLSERVNLTAFFARHGDWRQRVTRALMRLTYPRADCVVAVSEGVAVDLLRNMPLRPQSVTTIHNPVVSARLEELSAMPAAHPWLREPDRREVPVVLAAGRLIAQKDFALLLDAYSQLRRTRRARLVILGEGDLREALLAQAARLGVAEDVALPGFDANPFASMRAASVFVLTSQFEGLPGVLIQAMACGTRVVSTDCPSGPAEVLQGGRWGRLVPVGDAAALAAAMVAALDDPAPPDVRLRACDFSVERAVGRYAEVLGLV